MRRAAWIVLACVGLLVQGTGLRAEGEAWSEPSKMKALFESRAEDRIGLWIQLINEMSRDRKVTIAEIGVWRGDFAYQVLKHCPNVEKYYLVDPWRHLEDWKKPLNVDDDRFDRVFEATLKRLDFAKNRIVVLRGTTLEVVGRIPDADLDLVYIDGDHTAKGIVIDLVKLFPKVKVGGVVGGDDYVDDIYHHDPKRFDPTMVKPVVDGFVAAHALPFFYSNSTQFAFIK